VEAFLLAFIPLFVAIDVLAVVPVFMTLTEGLDERRRRRFTMEATLTAFAVSLVFLIAGRFIFSFLGITESDFRIGGGIVLLVISVTDLVTTKEVRRDPGAILSVVPIGIPLIMGPAALTTILILVDSYGYFWALSSLLVNLVIVWIVFDQVRRVTRIMGKAGSRAFGKVAALFMAAIAVMMIRSGVMELLKKP
jgi:multiple antibiotic resistance protein